MKITKAKLKQIIKEEVSDIFEVHEWGMDKGDESKTHPGELDYDNTAMNTVDDALEKVLPTIQDAYASLTDEGTQAQFEEHLLKNIQLYIKKWQAERGPEAPRVEPENVYDDPHGHPQGFPELAGQHSIRDYGE